MILMGLSILATMIVIMVSAWIYQRAAGNGGWTDVFWTFGTGFTCGVAALVPLQGQGNVGWRQGLVTALVVLWSLRLGSYIARRVGRGPEDVRYAIIRETWGPGFQKKMFGLLIVQAPVTALLGLAILFAAHQPDAQFRGTDGLGIAILAIAVLGEALADRQMKAFKADPSTQGHVCDRGLWAWSRHPNYFFEVLVWLAYPVIGFDPAHLASLLALVAPLLMFAVIRFGSGIPPLEQAMLKSKGDAYRRYQERVSALLPWPPRPTA